MTPVRIGDVTLYCGDSRDVIGDLRGCDALITDPPYGVSFSGKKGSQSTFEDSPAYFSTAVLPLVKQCIKLCRRSAIFSGVKLIQSYPRYVDMGGIVSECGSGASPWGFSSFQPVLFYGTSPYLESGLGSRPNTRVMNSLRETGINQHPAQKPLSFMLWAVEIASLPDETVLDPFMGSGTTGVACAILGRKFVGIELDPTYFELACQRIEEAYASLNKVVPEKKKGFMY